MDLIAGVFDTPKDAEQVLNQLNRLNLDADSLRVLQRGTPEESRGTLLPFATTVTSNDEVLHGTLMDYGFSQEDAELYDRELHGNSVMVIVIVDINSHDEAFKIMRHARGIVRL